ncbi:PX domain-containing protein kinase-like protein [Hyalella azteca]|uniref:PX domain-containing protein kinase-like protein n=1 Tax=Hyalella azteca TaxID=294128 RepID=A0A8B7PIN0_HYAAZ|nr:PX domain-containing protein kinase-like protein [Hyalella azteca]
MAMFDRRRENKQTFDESRNLNVTIRDCNNVDGHIEYKIEIWRSPEPEVRYGLTYRYSQFAQLNASLRAPNVTLPVLPPKKFFGNTDKSFVNDRKVALQNYMDELTKHPILRHHQALKNFLDPSNFCNAHHENGTMSVAAVLRSGGRLELGSPLTGIGWRYHKQYFHVSQVNSGSAGGAEASSAVSSSSSSPELTSAALAHTLHVAPPKASLMLWWCPYGIDSSMHLRDVHGTLTALVQCQHPYLATTLSSVATETGVCVTMPYYPQGSLRDLLYGSRPDNSFVVKYASNRSTSAAVTGVSIRSAAVYGRQILTALNFLHHFISCNVHLGNVVVVEGVCRLMGTENLVLGLPHPLRNLFTHVKSLNSIQAIDVYCFGHLLYEVVMRRSLTTPTCELLPAECPALCRSVLESIFSPEAAKNGMPTIEGLLTHPFFNEIPLHSHGRASLHLPANVKQALLATHQTMLSRLLADQKKVRLQKRIQKAEALLAQQSYRFTHRNKEAKKTGTKSAGATPPSSTITSPGTSSQGASQDNLSQPR